MQADLFMPWTEVAIVPAGADPYDHCETLTLPRPRKGWRGVPLAEIKLAHLPEGWIFGVNAMTTEGGFYQPLAQKFSGIHESRSGALRGAISHLLRFGEGCRHWTTETARSTARDIAEWAEGQT